ncbi:hypothetical protein [uncultured Citricoccus sp.]|uniref:hypothetical protein n=1 Tax=uncultured Citricoccus sp. TaxID=614031 RepID=UPI0026216849|nr:hypothetical protein [uncultured Citricoccus sp.]
MQTPSTPPPRTEQHTLTALLRVGEVAVAFREHVATGDLPGAWPLIDPTLRLAWARDWAQDHGARLRRLCPKRLAERLSCLDGPAHPLWKHFAADRLQQLRQVEAAGWSHSATGLPPLGPDTEVLYARPDHPEDWGAPADPRTVPMVMRWNGAAWKVLAYGSLSHPEPQ